MRLDKIIEGYNGKYKRQDASSLAFSLSSIKKGTLAFNLKSDKNFTRQAYECGAVAVVSEKRFNDISIPQIKVDNVRSVLALASKNFYHKACEKLRIFAVTGTNGKTTTCYFLQSILQSTGRKTALIGTNGVFLDNEYYPPTLTTPDPPLLHAIFLECVNRNITDVIMEASAHSLYWNKLDGINFECGAFTNFTQDHLDFFQDMQSYKRAKFLLFEKTKKAIVFSDDEVGREILQSNLNAVGYGESGEFSVKDISLSEKGSSFIASYGNKKCECKIALSGRYNIYNALCAIGMATVCGIDFKKSCIGVSALTSVAGRMNCILAKGGRIIIDYAHTEDGLRNLLSAVREFTTGRIITVFGCGGDRDKDKRPLMGKCVCKSSDITIVTSDNPRFEKPENIILQVIDGIKDEKNVEYYSITDREQAINFALEIMQKDDSVVIAGKGAEKYIEIKKKRIPHHDFLCVKKIIEERKYD